MVHDDRGELMTKETLIEFPCLFPIKIMGVNTPLFVEQIKQSTIKHFPNFEDKDLTQKLSAKSNYLALTVTVLAQNQEMLDEFYREVTKNEYVRMVL